MGGRIRSGITAVFMALSFGGFTAVAGLASGAAEARHLNVCAKGCKYTQIQDAVDAAAPKGDVVVVDEGVYDPFGVTEKSIQIVGSGPNKTVVSGTIGGRCDGVPMNLTIAALTVTGGVSHDGGGFNGRDFCGNLTLQSVTFAGDSAVFVGGGVLFYGDKLTVADCTIIDNSLSTGGGVGIAAFGNTVSVVRTLIANNVVNDPGSVGGAGIEVSATTFELRNSTVGYNTVASDGGGILIGPGTNATIQGTLIVGNEAASGAGIVNYGTLSLVDSNIFGNVATASAGAGAILNQAGGTVTFKSTTVKGNSKNGTSVECVGVTCP